MTETKALMQSRELTKFFAEHRFEPTRASSLAFGVKLLQLMKAGARKRHTDPGVVAISERAAQMFRALNNPDLPPISDVMLKNFALECHQKAVSFEHGRRKHAANTMRAVVKICDAYSHKDMPQFMELSVAQAAVKAFYAGADPEKIKAAALLLF